MEKPTIACIGAGHMGQSLIGGLIRDGYPPDKIWATGTRLQELERLQKSWKISVTTDNRKAFQEAEIIILAVKPSVIKQVTKEFSDLIKDKPLLIISVAAGVKESSIQRWLGTTAAIVRCMPNTAALIGSGATALYANPMVSTEHKNLAESIMRVIGLTVWVATEEELDIVTALSGSGPAYFFQIMHVLKNSACALGLPEHTAHLLITQTALGSARMALESGQTLEALITSVTSKGGTTEQALRVLEEGGLQYLLNTALKAAKDKAQEIGQLLDQQT